MDYLLLGILVVASYFMGNISFGRIISATRNVDITKQGSGNPGMTNVMRTHGAKLGVLVLLLDALKGAIPALAGVLLFGGYVDSSHLLYVTGTVESYTALFACGLASMVGHIFPVIYKFKGGKGVATFVGVFFVAQPIWSVLVFILAFLSVLIFKLMSVTSIGIVVLQTVIQYLYMPSGDNLAIWILIGVMAFLVIFSHRSNIVRLIKGTENITSIQDAIKKDKMRVKQEHKELRQEIKSDHKQVKQEHKEVLKQDKKDYKQKKSEIKQDKKSKLDELKDKKKQMKKDAKTSKDDETTQEFTNKFEEQEEQRQAENKKYEEIKKQEQLKTAEIKASDFYYILRHGVPAPRTSPLYEKRTNIEIGLTKTNVKANIYISGETFEIDNKKAKQIKDLINKNLKGLLNANSLATMEDLEGGYHLLEFKLNDEICKIDVMKIDNIKHKAEYDFVIDLEKQIETIIRN